MLRSIAGGAAALLLSAAELASAQTPSPTPTATPSPTPTPSSPDLALLQTFAEDAAKDAALFDFSYSAPNSSALPLVGVESNQIARVENLRRFGVSLLTGLESDEIGPAAAVDFSPYWLLSSGATSLEDYQSFSALQKLVTRTMFGVAAGEGDSGGGTPSSLVFSVSSKVLTIQDPLSDMFFSDCIKGGDGRTGEPWQLMDELEAVGVAAAATAEQAGTDIAAAYRAAVKQALLAQRPRLEAAYQQCVDRTAARLAQRPSLDVGGGYRLTGTPGKFSQLKGSGLILWGTLATGNLGGNPASEDPFVRSLGGVQMRGVLHLRYTRGQEYYDPVGVSLGKADSALAVAGIESIPVPGRPDTFRWSLQGGWNRQGGIEGFLEKENYWRVLGNADVQISEGLWLRGSLGRVEGRGAEDDTYLLFGISFAPSTGTTGIGKFYDRVGR